MISENLLTGEATGAHLTGALGQGVYAFVDIFPGAEFVICVGSLISIRQVTFNIGNSILRKSTGI